MSYESLQEQVRRLDAEQAETSMLLKSYENRLASLFIMRDALKAIAIESSDDWAIEVAANALDVDGLNDGNVFEGE